MDYGTAIPGYAGYTITANGHVYHNGRLLTHLKNKERSGRVKLRNGEGKMIRIAVAKLIAIAFIPNPNQHAKIIFKDRDKSNFHADNIQWVSAAEWCRFVNHYAESEALLGPPKPKRQPDPIDPTRIPLNGYPGYYITKSGVVYKKNRIVKPIVKKNKSLKVRIRQNGTDKFFGLAKLVAEHFIPNPKHHEKIIFKDRDNHNCKAENIAWVDGETFIYYSGIYVGMQKKVLPREEAIRQCRNMYLRRYYQTLDESWLHECWQELEKKITLFNWHNYRSDCYMYFTDRAKRFSITGDPLGLILHYVKGVRAKFYKEISPDMRVSVVRKTDESLRIIKRNYYDD